MQYLFIERAKLNDAMKLTSNCGTYEAIYYKFLLLHGSLYNITKIFRVSHILQLICKNNN